MTRTITHKPTTPSPRWRTWAFRGTLATFLFALLLVGAIYGWKYWQSRPLLKAQRQCLTYTMPPTDVVYESDPVKARALAALHPADYQLFPGYHRDFAMATPACWTQFLIENGDGSPPSPVALAIFLHERISRGSNGGQRRLVHVTLKQIPMTWIAAGGAFLLDFAGESWEPATLSSPAVLRSPGSWEPATRWESPVVPTRIYAGQVDPADDSHFTFDYEAYGQRDTVDGWLEANDSVTLKPRHPPALP